MANSRPHLHDIEFPILVDEAAVNIGLPYLFPFARLTGPDVESAVGARSIRVLPFGDPAAVRNDSPDSGRMGRHLACFANLTCAIEFCSSEVSPEPMLCTCGSDGSGVGTAFEVGSTAENLALAAGANL
jgi:hypothetical protein